MNELRTYSKAYGLAPAVALVALFGACDGAERPDMNAQPGASLREEGAASTPVTGYAVGTASIVIDAHSGRKLPVQLWYPAVDAARAEAAAGRPAYELEPAGPRRDKIKGFLESGTPGCTNRTMHAAIDAAPSEVPGKLPLIVVSHHFAGTRFSTFTVNEKLASLGFLVAAPDHVDGSLFDLDPTNPLSLTETLSAPFLKTRAADIGSVLDVVLSTSSALPAGLRGRADAARIGVYGHSFGAMTAGMVEASDQRVKAAAYLAMVVTSPLVSLAMGTPGIARFRVPGLYLLAQEDKSASAVGGAPQIRANFTNQKPPAWLVEIKDLGHFAVADDLSAVPGFADGCGKGTRVDRPSVAFTNIDSAQAREITARYTSAFFANQFLNGPATALSEAVPPELVITRQRP